MPRACAVMPQVASSPISPSMWSPCMCVMKMRLTWLMFSSLRSNWCCVPSPQSKSHTSARCGGLSATHETFRARVGTPALVPRKVIRKAYPDSDSELPHYSRQHAPGSKPGGGAGASGRGDPGGERREPDLDHTVIDAP